MSENDFTVDTKSLSETGSFSCPKCRALLSPDDETDEAYLILGTSGNQVRLKCKGCGSNIRIASSDAVFLEGMQKDLALKGIEMKKETLKP